jgi:HEAT repeat protein
VRQVELIRTSAERSEHARDLGGFDPDEATRFLLSLAYDGATSDAAEDAILPALLSDTEEPWPLLLDIARDRELDEGVRKSALFWIGQGAAEAATGGLAQVAVDRDEAQNIRDAAIFALSQRPADEAVPTLIEVARTGDEAETRRTAMFWLAQSDDERVVRFFEDVLLGRIR